MINTIKLLSGKLIHEQFVLIKDINKAVFLPVAEEKCPYHKANKRNVIFYRVEEEVPCSYVQKGFRKTLLHQSFTIDFLPHTNTQKTFDHFFSFLTQKQNGHFKNLIWHQVHVTSRRCCLYLYDFGLGKMSWKVEGGR